MSGLGNTLLARMARRLFRSVELGVAWWVDELGRSIPPRVRHALAGDAELVTIQVQGNLLRVKLPKQDSFDLPLHGDIGLSPDVRQALRNAANAVLYLPATAILRRTIELPAAAIGELRSAVSFLIERHTPYTPDQVQFVARVLSRDRMRKTSVVELAVLPLAALTPLTTRLGQCGLNIGCVRLQADNEANAFSFIQQRSQASGMRSWRHEPWKPVCAIAIMLLIGGPLLLRLQLDRQVESLSEEVRVQSIAGREGVALRTELQERLKAAAFLPKHRTGPRRVELLAALTKALPDESWLFDLEVASSQVNIAGFSSSVPQLIERLQAYPLFDAPELRAPVTHGVGGGKDRFELQFKIRENRT